MGRRLGGGRRSRAGAQSSQRATLSEETGATAKPMRRARASEGTSRRRDPERRPLPRRTHVGAPGLALGTTLGALVNVGLLRLFFARSVGPLARPGRARELGWMLLANATMGAVLFAAWTGTALGLARLALPGPLATMALAVALLLIVALGFLTYVGVLRHAHFSAADGLARLPGALWRRLRRRPK